MADVTISNLPSLAVSSGLLLPVTDGSSTGRVSISNINSLAPVQSVAGRTGSVVLAKSDVGLGSVENKSSATIRSEITSANIIATASPTIVKAWVNFNGIGTVGQNMTLRSQYNIASVYKVGTGHYRLTFTSAMNNINYCVLGTCSPEYNAYWLNVVVNSNNSGSKVAPSTSQFEIATVHQTVGGGHDAEYVNLMVLGT